MEKDMLKPTISIIVPVYNTKEYLKRCVDSLLQQDYSEKEIILVDDGSTDGSDSVCDEYSRRYPVVQVVHKKNGGLMSAWMAGVQKSTGRYLCFVDSDDWVEDRMLQEMSQCLSGERAEIVMCGYSIDKDGRPPVAQKNLYPSGIYERPFMDAEIFPILLGNEVRPVSFSRCMKLISRELIEKNIGFCDPQLKMGEDVNIMLPAVLDAERLVIMEDACFYHYYFNHNSMVHKYDTELYHHIQRLYEIIRYVISEKVVQPERRELMLSRADKEYVFLLMLVLKNEARGNPKGYRQNILNLCKGQEFRKLVDTTPVIVEQKANKLLYLVMKRPNHLTVTLLRMAMIWYYRKA